MSKVPGTKNVVIGLGGVAITAGSAWAYATTAVGMLALAPIGVGVMLMGDLVVPCVLQYLALTVTPDIAEPADDIWWRDGVAYPGVAIMLSLKSAPSPGRYKGGGTLFRGAATLQVFRDQACKDALVFDRKGEARIAHAELTSGQPFYLRGTSAGNVGLRLTLDPPPDAYVTVGEPARRKIEVDAVNVITPILTTEPLVLVDAADPGYPTTPSQVRLSCKQSNPKFSCADLRLALKYGDEITCRYADDPDTPYASAQLSEEIDLDLLMSGVSDGECALTLSARSASGATHPSWHLAPAVYVTVLVCRLAFSPWRYLECGDTIGSAQAQARVVANPKCRELHHHDPGGFFETAKVAILSPGAAFWEVASALTLTADAGLRICKDKGCKKPVAALVEGDFAEGDMTLWVRTTAVTPMDAQPAQESLAALPLRAPEKVVTPRRIFCGATVDGRTLAHGDSVRLDTFSFDQLLDNKTANATSQELKRAVKSREHLSAVAIAGGHKFYDAFSKARMNHQKKKAPPGGLYQAFCGELTETPGDSAAKAAAGVKFVADYLQNYKVDLHPTTRELLKAHIEKTLDAEGVAGFKQLSGTPGTHAEVLAVDELLTKGVPLTEISVATYKIHPSGGHGKHFVACKNCSGILHPSAGPKPRVLTGVMA